MNFKAFQQYSFEDWKKAIRKFDSPIEKEIEGIHVPILSTKQRKYPLLPSFPAQCFIAQRTTSDSPHNLRASLLQAEHHGQHTIHLDSYTIENCFNSLENIVHSLQDVSLTRFCVESRKDIEATVQTIHTFFAQKGEKPSGVIALSLHNGEEQLGQFGNVITYVNEHNLALKCGIIDTTEKKGTAIDELAFFFASSVQWVESLKEKGFKPSDVFKHLVWKCTIGHSIFLEISKLRAFRILWFTLLEQYGVDEINPTIISETKEIETSDENCHDTLIGATLQGFASVVGGSDYLHIQTFETEEGTRLARNVQHILLEESKLFKVRDPLAGSYTVEDLTYYLCEEAWAKLLEIEQQGGINQYETQSLLVNRGEE